MGFGYVCSIFNRKYVLGSLKNHKKYFVFQKSLSELEDRILQVPAILQ